MMKLVCRSGGAFLLVAAAAALLLAGCAANTQSANIKAGQLYCAEATATGPLVVALANLDGVPVKATNQAAANVAAACALINAMPVSPPANPAQAPVVAAPTSLPPA